jgi:(2Fe-2S) ferredoxin
MRIKPGRAVWAYLDGGGRTLEGMKQFSRQAGELGFEYNVLEGFWAQHGPNMIVYPAGIWYSGVRPEDVAEIVESHFQKDIPVERLARIDPADVRAEILANRERMLQAPDP